MPMFPAPDKFSVKICGITRADQALAIVQMGADALGLNFWPQSKRYIAPASAAQWAPPLRSLTTLVGVLVNPTPALLMELIKYQVADVFQLHGDESPEECERIMSLHVPVIKALQVRDHASLAMIGDYPCETILLDAYNPGLYGGEGKAFPWELASEAQLRFPEKRFILAGGLTPENVADAVAQVQPCGVDVASGVESSPGIKDLDLVRKFIKAAKGR